MLIDLDSSAIMGCRVGNKSGVSGYAPPELFRGQRPLSCSSSSQSRGGKPSDMLNLADEEELPFAQPSYDMWSYGVMLYEMCTGLPLFHLDLNDDNLESEAELAKLREWRGIELAHLDHEARPCPPPALLAHALPHPIAYSRCSPCALASCLPRAVSICLFRRVPDVSARRP